MDVKPLKLPDDYEVENYGDGAAYTVATFNDVLKNVYIGPIRDQLHSKSILLSENVPLIPPGANRYATIRIRK
jgi:hypothetical protein